jgi:putative SOS response-associated peptidase YedK
MCGRFTHMYSWREIHDLLSLTGESAPAGFGTSYNVAPTQLSPVVRLIDAGRTAAMLKWGLMPSWATKPGPFNARAETVATLPTFRSAFKARRCIVPASGFYEWQKTGAKVKQPWYIHRADGAPLLFAGLWESNAQGETFTIITTAANAFMRSMHDRMPVVLEPESAGPWLAAPAPGLLRPAADGILTAHKVSGRVGSPKNNEPGLIAKTTPA